MLPKLNVLVVANNYVTQSEWQMKAGSVDIYTVVQISYNNSDDTEM